MSTAQIHIGFSIYDIYKVGFSVTLRGHYI